MIEPVAFDCFDAKREQVWLRVMVVGASGAGKTNSALELATGMSSLMGDMPHLVETQNRAANWYGDKYKFRLVDFKPPHHPLRFLSAVRFAASKTRIIIVDTLSDEHEGEQGVLELHDSILDQLVADKARRDGVSADQIDEKKLDGNAWNEAKKPRKQLIRDLRHINAHIIFTVRAKERSKVFSSKRRQDKSVPSMPKDEDGWVAVTDDDFLFECQLRMLLLPMSNGVPCWNPVADSERKAIRRPGQLDDLLRRFEGKQLSAAMGAEMARWAMGDAAPTTAPEQPKKSKHEIAKEGHDKIVASIGQAASHAELDRLVQSTNDWHAKKFWSDATRDGVMAAIEAKRATLAEGA